MGAFFTATSMIGFIAGAGIIVRNSIILVDFIELKLKEGMALEAAVEEAGVVRFRPMLLTAAAVVVGSLVILFDPISPGPGHHHGALARGGPTVYYLVALSLGRAAQRHREGLPPYLRTLLPPPPVTQSSSPPHSRERFEHWPASS